MDPYQTGNNSANITPPLSLEQALRDMILSNPEASQVYLSNLDSDAILAIIAKNPEAASAILSLDAESQALDQELAASEARIAKLTKEYNEVIAGPDSEGKEDNSVESSFDHQPYNTPDESNIAPEDELLSRTNTSYPNYYAWMGTEEDKNTDVCSLSGSHPSFNDRDLDQGNH